MYGLLLDCIQKFLREKYGEHYWAVIRRRAKLQNHWFVTHEVYSDTVMSDLIEAAASTLGEDRNSVMQMFGEYFVQNIGRYGYARLLRVLGRDMRDFLNGLDDLHEYLRFSYPKMRAPSFFCEQETPEGMIMHYTTKRRGYLPYVIGQLYAVGLIYQKVLEIAVISEVNNTEGCHVVLDLKFDNAELLRMRRPSHVHQDFQIGGPIFLDVFPFSLVFDREVCILGVGKKLQDVIPSLKGRKLDEAFVHQRPHHVLLKWESIIMHTNCMFELVTIEKIARRYPQGPGKNSPSMQFMGEPPHLKLKGQMMLISSGEYMVFLCSPVMCSPEELYEYGIFISDLSMHDSTRDYILAGSQQNPELALALNQEQIRSKQLEDNIQKTDMLLYQMIPKPIADKLREGETPLNTCKQWQCVSILFADIVGFTPMCMRLRPMEVVCLLNATYTTFDQLCEKHYVYKVQTIGDACMVLSGAPVEVPNHAELITDYGFSIIEAIGKILDPSTQHPLQIRVGIHSGTVVAGVVGSTFLRYDVFGDTVNTAARMEATGKPMKIHISEATALLLEGSNFVVDERGEMEVKGKGTMKTFWVSSKKSEEEIRPRPKSPVYDNRRNRVRLTDSWPRHKSVPVVSLQSFRESAGNGTTVSGAISHKSSLTPQHWPELDESLSSHPGSRMSSSGTVSETECPNQSIDIADVDMIQNQLMSPRGICGTTQLLPNNVSDELKSLARGNICTLTEFAKVAEENAQRSRLLANWASNLASVVQQHATTAQGDSPTTTSTDGKSEKEVSVIPPMKPQELSSSSYLPRSGLGSSVDKEDDDEPSRPSERTYCVIS